MLPMEPVAAAALIRALLWQLSRVFITPDSQHGISLSDSMALCCGWRSMQRGAVAACTVAVLRCSLQLGMWSWGRGSKGRISSSSFCRGRSSPFKMAASTSTQQPQAGPRAAVPGQRLLFASDDFFNQGIVAAPRTQLSCAPTRSLTDGMLRGRRHDTMVVALASASAGASTGAASGSAATAGGSQRCRTTVAGMVYVCGACVNRDMACGCLVFEFLFLIVRVPGAHAGPRDVQFLKEIGPSGHRKASPLSARGARRQLFSMFLG
jgi:hypothetical protein